MLDWMEKVGRGLNLSSTEIATHRMYFACNHFLTQVFLCRKKKLFRWILLMILSTRYFLVLTYSKENLNLSMYFYQAWEHTNTKFFLRIRSQLKGSFETKKKDLLYIVVGGKGNKKSSPRGFPDICTLNGKSRYCCIHTSWLTYISISATTT